MNLEIGGGNLVPAGWTNIDPAHGRGEWKRQAQETPWPAPTRSVDAIRASHVMEHIPAGGERIAVMNEAWRVLKLGGVFEVVVPFMTGSWHAIADPTHVSFWCPESFHYFDGTFGANADYGIRLWTTLELDIVDGWEGHWKGTPR